jgi:hypothetical protein
MSSELTYVTTGRPVRADEFTKELQRRARLNTVALMAQRCFSAEETRETLDMLGLLEEEDDGRANPVAEV